MLDLAEYREQSLETWGQMAPGWEARHDWLMGATRTVNEWLLLRVDPQAGEAVLEVAAGPGDLGFDVAERVGSEGRVISTDFAPEMVELARRFGSKRGVDNVEYRVLDAEKMELDSESVDAVVCRWGYMLMADPGAALRESRRVLRDGGRLAFAVWRTPDRNPWAALPGMTLVERGHMPPPDPEEPGIFGMGDPERVRRLVAEGGFGAPALEEIAFEFHYADFEDLWDSLIKLAGPIARVVRSLSEGEVRATREAIAEKIALYRNDDGSYTVPAATWGVLVR